MTYKVVGENEVEVLDGEKRLGVIRLHDRQWEYGTCDEEGGYPSSWVVLITRQFATMTGVADAIAEGRKFLG